MEERQWEKEKMWHMRKTTNSRNQAIEYILNLKKSIRVRLSHPKTSYFDSGWSGVEERHMKANIKRKSRRMRKYASSWNILSRGWKGVEESRRERSNKY